MSDPEEPEGYDEPTRLPDGGARSDGSPEFRRLGDFELLREIGRGGMGVVYEAHKISLRRRVALKVLPPGLGMSPEAKKRFEREAQAAAKLHHTNIVPVHAIGQDEGHHYYAMELIEGQSLDHVLRQVMDEGPSPVLAQTMTTAGSGQPQQSPPPTVSKPATTSAGDSTTSLGDTSAGSRYWFNATAKLIAEVADALDYAHGQGVIHRDIKPANLMLSGDGRLCVADFGLARVVQEPGMTVSGSLLGTPAYMSPEQIAGGRVKLDHRTDVYSLGAVLYEMLTLRRPFAGTSREEVLTAIMTKEPRSPRKVSAKIPQDLETICLKALEKDADRRYATAGELAQDLRQYLHGGLITARRAGPGRRAWKSIRRHPVAATAILAVVLLAVVSTVAWQAMSGRQASDIERQVSDARLMLTRGEYREALAATDAVLADDPNNVDARLLRARIDVHRWHWWDAVEAGRAVLEEDPDNWEAHLLIAAAAKKGDLYSVPVAEHLAEVERQVPETADAFFLRGWVAWQEERPREAIEWLDRALELDPGHAMALEVRSDTYVDLKDLPAALADAERLAVARPRGPEGPQQAGYVYMMLHDEARALEKLTRSIDLDPGMPGGYLQRARIHRDRGSIDEQIADLTRAVELDPEGGHQRSRGSAYLAKRDYDLAIADFRHTIETNPDNLWAYLGIFDAHFDAGRRDEARAVIGELESRAQSWVDPAGRGWYHEELAYLYFALEEYDRALAEAERAVELRPNWIRANLRLASVRRQTGGETAIAEDCDRMAALALERPDELLDRAGAMSGMCGRTDLALADYAKAIELAPSWAEPYQLRGFLLRNEKRFEEALADLDRAIDLTPSWVGLVYTRGVIYATMGRFDKALADYERCVELGVEGSGLREEQAVALHRLGREAEALQVLDDFVEKRPDNAWGHMARASLLAVQLGRVEEAMEPADRAVELEPGLAMPYWRRAAHGSATPGRCDQVRADSAKARELGTGPDWSALHALTLVLNFCYSCPDLCDPAKALELAREAVRYDSGSSFAYTVHGSALYRLGRFEEAREALLRSAELSLDADDHINVFFLAMASFESGKTREARKCYDSALAEMNASYHSKNPVSINVRNEAAEILGLR